MILENTNKEVDDIAVLKQDLRNKMRGVLDAEISALMASKIDKEKAISLNLTKVLPVSGVVATFNGFQNEPNLNGLLDIKDIKWVYPVIDGANMDFYQPLNRGDFVENAFGILEPAPERSTLTQSHNIKAMLIPGLAFDRQLRRLGRGRGFYDRYLQNFSGIRIGIAFKCQVLTEELPTEEYDQKMDFLITEDFILQRFDV